MMGVGDVDLLTDPFVRCCVDTEALALNQFHSLACNSHSLVAQLCCDLIIYLFKKEIKCLEFISSLSHTFCCF